MVLVPCPITVSQITNLTIVYSTIYSGADQRKHQSSASLAFVRGIHRRPVNSPHKGPVTRKMFPFDDVIMETDLCRHVASPCYNELMLRRICINKKNYERSIISLKYFELNKNQWTGLRALPAQWKVVGEADDFYLVQSGHVIHLLSCLTHRPLDGLNDLR